MSAVSLASSSVVSSSTNVKTHVPVTSTVAMAVTSASIQRAHAPIRKKMLILSSVPSKVMPFTLPASMNARSTKWHVCRHVAGSTRTLWRSAHVRSVVDKILLIFDVQHNFDQSC